MSFNTRTGTVVICRSVIFDSVIEYILQRKKIRNNGLNRFKRTIQVFKNVPLTYVVSSNGGG